MGKSCFKILTCARADSVDDDYDGAQASLAESKVSSDKRRRSFRKRSAEYQMPINNAISEPFSVSYTKESSEITLDNIHTKKDSSIPENALILGTKEAPPDSSVFLNSEPITPLVPDKYSTTIINNIQESDIVIIQAVIRGCMARKELHNLRKVVKLQAVVRGHLVRRQAVGTLRCVHAIVKMQVLVRARQACHFKKKFSEQDEEMLQGERCSKLEKRCSSNKSLLSNGFARQLLESAPTPKSIYISCDPPKSDTSWRWLERWMAITLSEREHNERTANEKAFADLSLSTKYKLASLESAEPTEDEAHGSKNAGAFEFHPPVSFADKCLDLLAKNEQNQSQNESKEVEQEKDVNVADHIVKPVSFSSEIALQTDKTSELFSDSFCDKAEPDSKMPKHKQLDAEGEMSELGQPSSKFSAGESESEERSMISTVDSSVNSLPRDATAVSRLGSTHRNEDSLSMSKDLALAENSLTYDKGVQVAASECETEISISSTLDSDKSEAEAVETVLETWKKQKADANGEVKSSSLNLDVLKPHRLEESNGNFLKAIASMDKVPAELTAVCAETPSSSLEQTPRSPATPVELHVPPSSQTTLKAKKNRSKMANGKQNSEIGRKKSQSHSNKDSGGRSSTDQLQKDPKYAKRRHSLEITTTSDHVDQEPRISVSNLLPSYMQATESARAKAHTSSSPKSSPDVQNKDNHMKKRHSLPFANGKQDISPRIQRSTSQAHRSPKANDVDSPHNAAERRWQR